MALDYAGDQVNQPLPPVFVPQVKQPAPPQVTLTPDDAKLYKSTSLSSKYIFKNGMVATFINGRYATNKPYEIAELDAEISYGHPNIYFDIEEPTSKHAQTAMLANLEAQFYRKFIAEQEAGTLDPSKFMGETAQSKLNPSSTRDIQSVAAGQGPSGPGLNFIPATSAPK